MGFKLADFFFTSGFCIRQIPLKLSLLLKTSVDSVLTVQCRHCCRKMELHKQHPLNILFYLLATGPGFYECNRTFDRKCEAFLHHDPIWKGQSQTPLLCLCWSGCGLLHPLLFGDKSTDLRGIVNILYQKVY